MCGKKLEPNDNRYLIKDCILKKAKKIGVFAEDIYNELKDSNLNLLEVEEIIFNICSALIIIVESYGSACELGAFSLKNKTLRKVWVINNEQYKNDESFIQTGPIAKIKTRFPDHVCYEKFRDTSIEMNSTFTTKIKNISGKKNFVAKPYYRKQKNIIIKDLSFLTHLIFDYIRIFKILIEDNLIERLRLLFDLGKFRNFKIELSSSNNLVLNKYQVIIVFKAILKVLNKSGIINKNFNKTACYYTLNYNNILETDVDPRKLSSLIFTSDFF